MLLGTLGASLLGNLLSGKGMMRAGEGIVRDFLNDLKSQHIATEVTTVYNKAKKMLVIF